MGFHFTCSGHGWWALLAMGGGLCSPVVTRCLGGFGCWFGGCLGVGLIGGCLRQWVFGWRFWVTLDWVKREKFRKSNPIS